MQKLDYIIHINTTTGAREEIEVKDNIVYDEADKIFRTHTNGTVFNMFSIQTVDKDGRGSINEVLIVDNSKGFNPKKISLNETGLLLSKAIPNFSVRVEEVYQIQQHLGSLHKINPNFDIYGRYAFVSRKSIYGVNKYEAPEVKSEEDEDIDFQVNIMRGEIYGRLK